MKVTKLIREYVTEKVSEVYDSRVNPFTEQAKADKEMLDRFEEELRNNQQAMLDGFVSEHELYCYWGDHEPATKFTATTCSIGNYLTKSMMDERRWRYENNRQKKAKIQEIILNLELGATRKELDEMLANVLKGDAE
jgi:hypothetical protein